MDLGAATHSSPMNEVPIRDAATVVVVRDTETGPAVLMGQRGAKAAFMPSKYVFPGGAVDQADAEVPFARPLSEATALALKDRSAQVPEALASAAIRELWEETGQILAGSGITSGWPGFPTDQAPDAAPLTFFFRAITPPGRPRRFDARFFLINADDLSSDPDDFTHATDELSHLHWVPLTETHALDVPFITEVVLAEVSARVSGRKPPPGVPFFDNSGEGSRFSYLGA